MDIVKNFDDFSREYGISEADGFGTLPYLEKKDGNVYYYFFKLDTEKGGSQRDI